jgi:hypothetical protein
MLGELRTVPDSARRSWVVLAATVVMRPDPDEELLISLIADGL